MNKRFCNHCGELFNKMSKYNKVCPACVEKSKALGKIKAQAKLKNNNWKERQEALKYARI